MERYCKYEKMSKPEGERWKHIIASYLFYFDDCKYIVDHGKYDKLDNICVRRTDRKPIMNFFDMQMIKDIVLGEDRVAVQVFPKKSDMMNGSNSYHMWSKIDMDVPNMVEIMKPKKVLNEYGDSNELYTIKIDKNGKIKENTTGKI